jgi:hypothetical protein
MVTDATTCSVILDATYGSQAGRPCLRRRGWIPLDNPGGWHASSKPKDWVKDPEQAQAAADWVGVAGPRDLACPGCRRWLDQLGAFLP